ncbi:NAD-dependent epimerase/dehydratase family protein [Pontimonas sp.]|nr:NAD-dependent epimerase/dehydratase family protein [Pontimonas sp.]
MKILVTGSAGMIGSNLTEYFLNEGFEVIGVDNHWRGKRATTERILARHPRSFSFIDADLRLPGALDPLLADVGHVFHLADVVAGINFVFDNEFLVWSDNLAINSNVLKSLLAQGVGRVTYVGSACSYPKSLTKDRDALRPLKESDAYPAEPESSYGWSKLMGEYELGLAEKSGLISVAILRLHNVYGFPTELLPDRSQVIPALARKIALFPKVPFEVWGSGNQKRSFVYVHDVVHALAKTLSAGLGHGPIQIGPAASTSIGEIARKLASVSGKDIEPVFDSSRTEGDGDRYPDLSRATDILGWSPTVTLDEGLAEVYAWVEREVNS